MNIQDWFPLGLTGSVSLKSKGLSSIFNTTVQKYQFFDTQPSLWSNSHIHTWLLENNSFAYIDFVGKAMSLLFNMLSRFVIDGWMASLTQWTWVWVNCRSWWWTGKPGVQQSMRLQRVRHDWAIELNNNRRMQYFYRIYFIEILPHCKLFVGFRDELLVGILVYK